MKRFHTITLFFILAIALFFRFYNVPYRYGIGDDSSRDAFVAYQGAKDLQLPLTGPFSSLGQFTFGPWYYWQLIAFTRLTGHPFAPWIYLAIASTVFVFMMYTIGKRLMNPTAGLIVALLTAISPPQISSAKGLTNPNLISIFAGLSVLLFLKVTASKHSPWWWFLWGIILGIGINIHYQMAGLLILLPLAFFAQKKSLRLLMWTCLGLFVTFIPMLLFDLNNHWFLLRHMSEYYLWGKNAYYIPYRWLWYLRDFWPQFWAHSIGLPLVAGIPLLGAIGLTTVFAFRKNRPSKQLVLLLIAFCVNFLMLRYYWGERFFGYLQFLHPFLFLLTGFALWNILRWNRWLGLAAMVTLIVFSMPASIRELQPDWGQKVAREDVAILKEMFPSQSIRVYSCKRRNFSQTIAVVYLLHVEQRVSGDSGPAVGYGDDQCGYPPTDAINKFSPIPVAEQLKSLYPDIPKTSLFDLTHATPSALASSGWGEPITPKGIFDATVRWWFREQP